MEKGWADKTLFWVDFYNSKEQMYEHHHILYGFEYAFGFGLTKLIGEKCYLTLSFCQMSMAFPYKTVMRGRCVRGVGDFIRLFRTD